MEENDDGEAGLALHVPLQLLHLRLDHQVNRFMGCDCHIEEYHKALKTGLGAERLQFETAARLFAAVAIMSVVALRLVGLREQVRCLPDHPAEAAGLENLDLEVLRMVTARPLRTVQDVALAIGRLGGHLNRHQDGLPGWQTLWLGMKKLALLVKGVRLARQMNKFG
jgi:hypothetical protein